MQSDRPVPAYPAPPAVPAQGPAGIVPVPARDPSHPIVPVYDPARPAFVPAHGPALLTPIPAGNPSRPIFVPACPFPPPPVPHLGDGPYVPQGPKGRRVHYYQAQNGRR